MNMHIDVVRLPRMRARDFGLGGGLRCLSTCSQISVILRPNGQRLRSAVNSDG